MSWIEKCYSRLLIDNHITDQLPRYMSRFDPAEYVRLVRKSGVDSAMVYACDHNGNCYYPTQCGHMHEGLKGRNIFADTVSGLQASGIVPVAYYTVNYHNDSASRFPACRMRDSNGMTHSGRYHYSCPNHPEIVQFFQQQILEIVRYPIAGLFIDMTFWPMVCCCDACKNAFRQLTGAEIPGTLDWDSALWRRFQEFREDSLSEFAEKLTATARAARPEISVTHQFSPVLHGWLLGQSAGIAEASDYASGDFYGGKNQQRLGVKVFAGYSTQMPYEFMTSRCVNLNDHTSSKSDDELYLHALTTLANAGAYFFIDAINPDGTLEEAFYDRLQALNQRLKPFKNLVARHRPVPAGEVGVYFSTRSCVDRNRNGMSLQQVADFEGNMGQRHDPVIEELLGITSLLQSLHIPYRMITERTDNYGGLKALITANADFLEESEYEKFRQFTAGGGLLIATGNTSRHIRKQDHLRDFYLADVFGVQASGKDTGSCSYLALPGEMLSANGVCPLAMSTTATVHAPVNLPDFPVNDAQHYASIHSNPPGKTTEFAGMTENVWGRGKCFWFYSNVLGIRNWSQQKFAGDFLQRNLPAFVVNSENLPASTELTLLQSATEQCLILGIVNYQDELPNIPLHDLRLTFRLPEAKRLRSCIRASDNGSMKFTENNALITFEIPRLDDGELFELHY